MTWVVVAFVVGLVVGVPLGKVKLRRGPVNIVRGMLFPMPGDERWKRSPCSYDYICEGGNVLGKIRACGKHGLLFVDGERVGGGGAYARAVAQGQAERKALAAALDEKS